MLRFVLLFSFALAALAQSAIQGGVTDPSGAPVPDATITAVLDATGAMRSAQTGPDGRYRMPGLAIGSYTIRCLKAGFQTAETNAVYLGLNQTVEQAIHLKLA